MTDQARWSISAQTKDGRTVGIAFDANDEQGMVWIQRPIDDPIRPMVSDAGAGGVVSARIDARELAIIIRTLEKWPLDVLDAIADADERRRRGHSRSHAVSGELSDRRMGLVWISTKCGNAQYAVGEYAPGIKLRPGDREDCVSCERNGCEAVLFAVELSSLRAAAKRAAHEPRPGLRVRVGAGGRMQYSDDGVSWCLAEEYAERIASHGVFCSCDGCARKPSRDPHH